MPNQLNQPEPRIFDFSSWKIPQGPESKDIFDISPEEKAAVEKLLGKSLDDWRRELK